MLEIGRLTGRVSLKTSDPLIYRHTSERSGWNGAVLTHIKTTERGSVHGCWNMIVITYRIDEEGRFIYVDKEGNRRPAIGHLHILPPFEVRRGVWEGSSETLSLFISPKLCEFVLGRPLNSGKMYFHAEHTHNDPIIENLLKALLADSLSHNPSGPGLGDSIIAAIIHRLNESNKSIPATHDPDSQNDVRVRIVKNFIDANLSSKLTADELAIVSNLSTRHLCRAFKEATGLSPYQYITMRRLDNAKDLILEGNLSLQEVAAKTGFVKHGNLSAAFRAAFGITPSQFRNSLG